MSRPLREATTYLVLVFSLAIGVAVAMPDANINKLLSALLPVTGVIIITFAVTPRGRRRELWASFGLTRSGKRMWPMAILVPMALAASAYAVAVVLGVADLRDIDPTSSGVASWILNLVVSLAFMTVLFLGEEIGWRGYLLPRIQQLTSRRRAALMTGFIHGMFHLPLILIATTYDAHGARWIVAPMVVATITMGGVFYAYLWDMTGTVWPVAMAHGFRELHVRSGRQRRGGQLAGRPCVRRRRERSGNLCRRGGGSVAVPGSGHGVAHRQRCGGQGGARAGAGRLRRVLWPVDPAVLSCC